MNPLVLHRLYLTIRFLAALFAACVLATLATIGVHDYAVQQTDSGCFVREWDAAITRDSKEHAEAGARSCTPEVLAFLKTAGSRPDRRKLSNQEWACLTRSDPTVWLSEADTKSIEEACHVVAAFDFQSARAAAGTGPFPTAREWVQAGFTAAVSTRSWRYLTWDEERRWRDTAMAAAAFAPLLVVVGGRRWLRWLVKPGRPTSGS